MVNTGVYLINSSIIPDDSSNYKIESDFFPKIIQSLKVKAYFHNGFWSHIQEDEKLQNKTL